MPDMKTLTVNGTTYDIVDETARNTIENLTASDVGARPDTWTPTASDVGAVPSSRTVNGKALSSNITLSASDVGAVPSSRTVNGKALSSNITLSASDVGARASSWTPTAENVGAVPLAGGTMTGALTTTALTVTGTTPKVTFNETDKKASAHYVSSSRHVFQTYATDADYYENFRLPTVSTGLTANTTYDILTTKVAKDYVTAQGTSDGWQYIKWNSGNCVCWKPVVQASITDANWSAWGGIYLTPSLPRQSLPITMTGATQLVTAHCAGNYSLGVIVSGDCSGSKTSDVCAFRGTKPGATVSIVYNFTVFGKWK